MNEAKPEIFGIDPIGAYIGSKGPEFSTIATKLEFYSELLTHFTGQDLVRQCFSTASPEQLNQVGEDIKGLPSLLTEAAEYIRSKL